MSSNAVFGAYADYYDLLYQNKDYAEEAQKVDRLLQRHGLAGKRILDIGCGTGRHAMAMAELGYEVTGIDLSEEMLKFAQERISNAGDGVPACRFYSGDARTYRGGETYDAVTSLFHVMCYQNSDDDLRAAFETAAAHLNPGGTFLFDMWYGTGVLTDPPTTRVKRMGNDQLQITRIAEPDLKVTENVVDVHYQVFAKKPDDEMWAMFKELHSMRYLFETDVRYMADGAGFEILSFLDWDTEQSPTSSSWNACCVLRKKSN